MKSVTQKRKLYPIILLIYLVLVLYEKDIRSEDNPLQERIALTDPKLENSESSSVKLQDLKDMDNEELDKRDALTVERQNKYLSNYLNESKVCRYWDVATLRIAWYQEPDDTQVLLTFLQRHENWHGLNDDELTSLCLGKMSALLALGLVNDFPPKELLKYSTQDGAEELLMDWGFSEEFSPFWNAGDGRSDLLETIRGRAYMGVVYTRASTEIKKVRDEYSRIDKVLQEHAKKAIGTEKVDDVAVHLSRSELYGALVDACATDDLIEEIGLQKYWELTAAERLQALHKYYEIYDIASKDKRL